MKDYTENLEMKNKPKDMNEFFSSLIEHHVSWMKSIPNPNPLWLLLLVKGELQICNIINATGKSPMSQIAEIIKSKKPEAYIFFSEGWFKSMTKEEMENIKYGDIGDSEDKKECLTVIGRTIDGLYEVKKFFLIKRNGKDKRWITDIEEVKEYDELEVRKLP